MCRRAGIKCFALRPYGGCWRRDPVVQQGAPPERRRNSSLAETFGGGTEISRKTVAQAWRTDPSHSRLFAFRSHGILPRMIVGEKPRTVDEAELAG